MDTTVARRGGNSLVSVSGRITIDSSPDLRALLLKQLKTTGCESLTLDLYDVAYVDVSGVAVLLEVLRAVHLVRSEERPLRNWGAGRAVFGSRSSQCCFFGRWAAGPELAAEVVTGRVGVPGISKNLF